MKETFFRLLQQIRQHRHRLIFALGSAFFSVMALLLAPLVIGRAIDHMVTAGQVNFPQVFSDLVLITVIYLGSNFFLWLLTYLTNRISYDTMKQLRIKLFERLQILPLAYYDQTSHGDIVSRFINDIDSIGEGLLQGLIALLQGVITIVGAILVMVYINPVMALVVMLSAPAAFYVARFITLRSQQMFARQARYLGQLNGFAEEMIEGQKIVKAFQYEDQAQAQFEAINQRLYDTGLFAQFYSALAHPSTRIVNNIAYGVIGVIGSIKIMQGDISVGDLSSFLIYATIFSKPFNDITNVLTQIQAAIASSQRVFQLIDQVPEVPDRENALQLTQCQGQVSFDQVSFSYQPEVKLIENFNLEILPGSRVAIVGHTGAGKTTLVNLLMRFYDVNQGAIRLDGIDIRDLTRESLRRQFGMVLQDTWLFQGSIRDNIAYGKPEATLEEIVTAAKAAGADSFIRRLDQSYDTLISADGDSLSQGQMQLLTIARVMLANPPMLILDEATSNIDPYTEIQIQQAFERLTAGRTSFVIAHRLSTVKNADLILVMEQGHVVEQGNHESLLKQESHYAALYQSQFAPNVLNV